MSNKHLNLKMKDHFFCMKSENWLLQLASRHDMNRTVGEALCICNLSTWYFSFSVSAYSTNLICDQEDAGAGLDTSLLFWESNLFTEWGPTARKCTRKTVPVCAMKAYSTSSGTVHNYHDIIFCPLLLSPIISRWTMKVYFKHTFPHVTQHTAFDSSIYWQWIYKNFILCFNGTLQT